MAKCRIPSQVVKVAQMPIACFPRAICSETPNRRYKQTNKKGQHDTSLSHSLVISSLFFFFFFLGGERDGRNAYSQRASRTDDGLFSVLNSTLSNTVMTFKNKLFVLFSKERVQCDMARG